MNNLDSTMDVMENTRFITVYNPLIKEFVNTTCFSHNEVASLLMVYHKFVLLNGPNLKAMTAEQFYNLFLVMYKIYDRHITERILANISTDLLSFDAYAWMLLHTVFMSDNLDIRMKFAFEVYNFHGLGYLNREVVSNCVDKFFSGDDEDDVNELRADMVEFLFVKFDLDKDGVISYNEYESIVTKQPVLLEFLGQIFPSSDETEVTAYCLNIISYFHHKE